MNDDHDGCCCGPEPDDAEIARLADKIQLADDAGLYQLAVRLMSGLMRQYGAYGMTSALTRWARRALAQADGVPPTHVYCPHHKTVEPLPETYTRNGVHAGYGAWFGAQWLRAIARRDEAWLAENVRLAVERMQLGEATAGVLDTCRVLTHLAPPATTDGVVEP